MDFETRLESPTQRRFRITCNPRGIIHPDATPYRVGILVEKALDHSNQFGRMKTLIRNACLLGFCGILAASAEETLAPDWRVVEVGHGVDPSLVVDSQGGLHVMGMIHDGQARVWHAFARNIDSGWSITEVAHGYFVGPGAMTIDSQDIIHMAWHNHETEGPDHLVLHPDGQVKRFTIDTPGIHDGWDNALAVDREGGLHQISVNPGGSIYRDSLQYGYFDGTRWEYDPAITGAGILNYGLGTSVAVDSLGDVHVAYCQSLGRTTPGDLNYAVLKPSGWTITTVAEGGIRGRFPSIAVDFQNRPHLAWIDLDREQESSGTVRYAIFDDGRWQISVIDVMHDLDMSSHGTMKAVSIAVDDRNQPHLAYGDQRRIVYATRVGGENWVKTNVLVESESTYNGLVSIRLDSGERPAIVFWQPDQELSGLVRLARPNPVIRIETANLSAGSRLWQLRWSPGATGLAYVVEATNNLQAGNWTAVSGAEPLTVPIWTVLREDLDDQSFFRVRAVIPNQSQ